MMAIKDPDLARYARIVDHYLETMGHTYDTVGTYLAADERDPKARETRYRLWIGESLRYAIQELDCGNHVQGRKPDLAIVLRCLLQVREYCGRTSAPTSGIHDTMISLQNRLESRLRAA
jgi:hypothetical protein